MSTINLNSILSQQQSELLSHSRQPYENPKLLSTTSSSLPLVTVYDSIHGHTNLNLNNDGSNCHQSINQQKISALTMSQLSTVYATKRRRRNGKRWVSSFVLFLFLLFFFFPFRLCWFFFLYNLDSFLKIFWVQRIESIQKFRTYRVWNTIHRNEQQYWTSSDEISFVSFSNRSKLLVVN